MKTLLHLLLLVASLTVVAGGPTEQPLRNRAAMQKRMAMIVEDYASELNLILDGLRSAQATSKGEHKKIIDASVQSVKAILQDPDSASMGGLLPLINLLHTHNTDESPQIIHGVENSRAQTGLNYLIEGIFNARMMGAADTITEQELEEMLRFYADNPAQTSEISWRGNDEMLFVFGDRVLNTLAKKTPDRIDAFYKAVLDSRRSAQIGPGPDTEPIPDAERPTAEQLRAYEASFSRLEALATKGALPKSNLPSQTTSAQSSAIPPTVPTVQPTAPTKALEAKSKSSTPSEEPTSSAPWSIIVVLIVAATGLLWLLVKKRK